MSILEEENILCSSLPCLVVSPVFGQLTFASELAVLRFNVFSMFSGLMCFL